jgi:proteasome lid subunit RPN8/RPN11
MNEWRTEGSGCREAKDCSYSEQDKQIILLQPEVYVVITRLLGMYDKEWQMLLTGIVSEKGCNVTGYYIPKQITSYATVKNMDCIDKELVGRLGVVATIHSHVGMGVGFSATDHEYTNMSNLIGYHVVCNNKLEFNGVRQATLPCGLVKLIKTDVRIAFPEVDIVDLENIEEQKYIAPSLGNTGYRYEGGYAETGWGTNLHVGSTMPEKDTKWVSNDESIRKLSKKFRRKMRKQNKIIVPSSTLAYEGD